MDATGIAGILAVIQAMRNGERVQIEDAPAYVPERTCKMKDNWDNVVCSACGEIMFGMKVTNYCPNCGAKVVK